MAAAAFVPAAANAASPLDLGGSPDFVDLAPYVEVYEDASGTQSFDAVRSARFDPVARIGLDDARATYWLRFTMLPSQAARPWLLTAGFRPAVADLYLPDGSGGWHVFRNGDATPYAQRPLPIYNWIAFDLPAAGGPQTAYLRLKTIEPLVNAVAYTQERFRRDVTRDTVVIAALLAILGTLVISSVALFFVMRDTLYLYYAVYIVAQGIYRANDFGLLQAYVFPTIPFPYVGTEVFFDGVTLVAATYFIRRFLRSHAHSRLLDRACIAVAAIGAAYAVLDLFGVPIRYTLVQDFSFVYVPIWIATGVVCWRRGYEPAKLFLLAWTAYMVGIVIEAAVDAGIFARLGIARESTPDVVLDYIVYLGIALESILLSLSLAQAYKTAASEKIENLKELIGMRERTEQMAHLAYSDGLTNLPNRTAFIERVDESLRAARRHGRRCALLYLDFDGFKKINDSFGHHVGDGALIEAGARLRKTVRGDEMIGRLGGDEFGVFIPSVDSDDDVRHVVERIDEAIAEPCQVEGLAVALSFSVGVAYFPDPHGTREELIAAADRDMYRAKRRV